MWSSGVKASPAMAELPVGQASLGTTRAAWS